MSGKIEARFEWGLLTCVILFKNYLFVYFWLLPTVSLDTVCMVSSMQRLSDSVSVGATMATDGAETGNLSQPEKAAGAISSQGLTARKV